MIIYESIKSDFMDDVEQGVLINKIFTNFRNKIGKTSKSEINSWQNSLRCMYMVMNDEEIPYNSGIAIEYKIPTSSKRIDFIITGKDEERGTAVVVELKQWSEAEKVEGKDGIVKTALSGGVRETTHPSYQVNSYTSLIRDFNEAVTQNEVALYPCAYLHNYFIQPLYDPLTDDIYKEYIQSAPIFDSQGTKQLRDFIKKHVKYGDNKKTLYAIESGKIKPSKSLQESLLKMINGNEEFVMIDEQKVIYEQARYLAKEACNTGKKKTLIVKGGPGTGKSVLAIQLLVHLTSEEMLCHYVTKNTAPREVYVAKLKGHIKRSSIDNLFKSSGIYYEMNHNELDVVLVDEAQRLNEKSGLFNHLGENQTMELINSSKFSVFFIDERQRIHFKDAGKIETIKDYAQKAGADVEIVELSSQFRCNGSNGYLAFLDDVLEINETANSDGFDMDYDLQIVDDPNVLFKMILKKNSNNKARLLAGYCWEWDGRNKNNLNHHGIVIEKYGFSMSWNLGNTKTYAIDKESINQVGCIHTLQGLELEYVGVIIGKDLRYENNQVVTDFTKRARTDQSIKGLKKLMRENPDEAYCIADEIIKNTYRVLLTRGQKGCYIYCEDEALSQYLKRRIGIGKQFEESFYDEKKPSVYKVAQVRKGYETT